MKILIGIIVGLAIGIAYCVISTSNDINLVEVTRFYNGTSGYSISIPSGNQSSCIWTSVGGNARVPYKQLSSASVSMKHTMDKGENYDFKVICSDDLGNYYIGKFNEND